MTDKSELPELPDNMTLINFTTENIKRVRAVRLDLNGEPVTLIGGNNRQGKSSLLDALAMLLFGKDAMPAEPVRRGAKRGFTAGGFGVDGKVSIEVRRTIRPNRTHSLELRYADGTTYTKQDALDELIDKRTIDPLAFANMKASDQEAELRRLVGLDTSDLDTKEATARDERKEAKKDLQRAQHRLEELPGRVDAPAQEVSIAELMAELEKRQQQIEDNAQPRELLAGRQKAVGDVDQHIADVAERITALKQELADAEGMLTMYETQRDALVDQRDAQQKIVDALIDPDLDETKQQIAQADETNAKVRANQARTQAQTEVDDLQARVNAHDDSIRELQEQRAERMAAVKYPIEGLSFAPSGGVLYNGFQFSECSGAERLRVSCALGFAKNSKIKVLTVHNGSLLDDANLAILREVTAEHKGAIIMEVVGKRHPGAIIIEDGERVDVEAQEDPTQ